MVQNPVVPYHDYTACMDALLVFTWTCAAYLGEIGVGMTSVAGRDIGGVRMRDKS